MRLFLQKQNVRASDGIPTEKFLAQYPPPKRAPCMRWFFRSHAKSPLPKPHVSPNRGVRLDYVTESSVSSSTESEVILESLPVISTSPIAGDGTAMNHHSVQWLSAVDSSVLNQYNKPDDALRSRSDGTAIIKISNSFYDFEDVKDSKNASSDRIGRTIENRPTMLHCTTQENVSFLDISVWSTDPHYYRTEDYTDNVPKLHDKQNQTVHSAVAMEEEELAGDHKAISTKAANLPSLLQQRDRGNPQNNDTGSTVDDDEEEDDIDNFSTYTVIVPRRQTSKSFLDVSALTMDPALYHGSQFVTI